MSDYISRFLFFFFFQAEDGIRDKLVTGVQTCALPICLVGDHLGAGRPVRRIVKPAARAGSGFHQHPMAGLHQRARAVGCQPDAEFMVFDLLGDAEDHGLPSDPLAPPGPTGWHLDNRFPSTAPFEPSEVRKVPSSRRSSLSSMLSS